MTEKQCCPKVFDSILVAYDGSEFSEKALAQAIELAKSSTSKLYVMFVVYVDVTYTTYIDLNKQLDQEGAKILDQAVQNVKDAGLEPEGIIAHSSQPWQPIVEEAKKRNVSLIVLGTHGRTGITRLLLGSVAQLVAGNAPCPVMIVPR